MYDRILVATDGSESANRAIEQAADLADTFDAELYSIAVIDTRRYGDSMLAESTQVIADLETHARELLTELQDRTDIDSTTELRRGRPHVEIAEYAENIDANLLVIGNRGIGGGEEIGSTAERIVRHIDRPVLTA